MKSIKICILIAALCCMVPVSAQRMFASAKIEEVCSYYGETITADITAHEADETAEKVVRDIMSVIGLRPNFELRAANVPNAAAVIIKNKRYILYNPTFMNDINTASGTYWASISILAHEIGHHLNGHTLDQVGSRPATELEADEFSGFVLRKMGASLADAQAAMSLIASMKGSHTHPPKQNRLASIATGWTNAGELINNTAVADKRSNPNISRPAIVKKPAVMERPVVTTTARPKGSAKGTTAVVRTTTKQSLLDDKYIASEAYFNSDPEGKYYITTKAHLVQVTKDNIYLLGSLAQSNRSDYSLMLTDKYYNYLYIKDNGAIVNGAGSKVGYLKVR
jgi:hypothetical protein